MLRFWLPCVEDGRGVGLSPTSATSFSSLGLVEDETAPNGVCCTGGCVYHTTQEEFNNEFTIATWFNNTAEAWNSTGNTIISAKNRGTNTKNMSWYFSIYAGTDLALGINGGMAAYKKPYEFSLNTWYHLSATLKDGVYKMFINGELLGSGTTTNATQTGCDNIALGCRSNNTNGTAITGGTTTRLSDFRIYDNALSEGDIKRLYWGEVFRFAPGWLDSSAVFDAKGLVFPLTPKNITTEGNVAKFNGSNSGIEFEGMNLSGGTVSVWFSVESFPGDSRIIYYDPISRMVLGFNNANNYFLTAANGDEKRFKTEGFVLGQLNHVVVIWGSDRKSVSLYTNGVSRARVGSETSWGVEGTTASIGKRTKLTESNAFLNGDINEVRVFRKQLTQAEVKELYDKGPSKATW